MSGLVGNPDDRFSLVAADMINGLYAELDTTLGNDHLIFMGRAGRFFEKKIPGQ